jgi:hypothetical protein
MQENKKRRNHHELDKCYAQIAKTLKTLNALGSLAIDPKGPLYSVARRKVIFFVFFWLTRDKS